MWTFVKFLVWIVAMNSSWFVLCSSAQDTTILTYVDEVAINLNRSRIVDDPVSQRTGFGVGVYFSSPMEKILQFQTGVEYNLFRTYEENLYEGHYSSTSKNELSAHMLTLPFNMRINVGSSVKTFLQLGCFFDFVAISTIKGIRTHGVWDSEGHLSYVSSNFKEYGWTNSIRPGIALSVGNFFKIGSKYLGWKAEYKLGLIPLYAYQTSIPNSSAEWP